MIATPSGTECSNPICSSGESLSAGQFHGCRREAPLSAPVGAWIGTGEPGAPTAIRLSSTLFLCRPLMQSHLEKPPPCATTHEPRSRPRPAPDPGIGISLRAVGAARPSRADAKAIPMLAASTACSPMRSLRVQMRAQLRALDHPFDPPVWDEPHQRHQQVDRASMNASRMPAT